MQVGDVMQDVTLLFSVKADVPAYELPKLFILAALHLAENTERLVALNEINVTVASVVLRLHPLARMLILQEGLGLNVHLTPSVGYFEMVWLLYHCHLVLTLTVACKGRPSSFGKACVTMCDQAEWVELVEVGAN